MTAELCKHELDPDTCTICKHGAGSKFSQGLVNAKAVREAVDDLAEHGSFTTKEVAAHEAVRKAHAQYRDDERFAQQIGSYLTGALGLLRIEQISPKGQSNARWQRRSS